MGVYLLISLNVFGRHSEEAFSGLRIEDYKHFLRLHIDRTGALTIWPIKIERVPRRWRDRAETDATRIAGRSRRAAGRRADRATDHGAVATTDSSMARNNTAREASSFRDLAGLRRS